MRIGRNDPCPCGSGVKYKRCCMARDAEASASGVLPFRGARANRQPGATGRDADGERVWDAEAVPLLIAIEERGSERPVLLLVTAGGFVLRADIKGRLGGSAGTVAAALERAVADAARDTGAWPERVRVRHEAVADALRPLLEARDVHVAVTDPLPAIEDAARALMDRMAGDSLWPPIGRTRNWGAWDLPGALVSDTFRAAAGFWRAAPWRFASNLQAPRLILPAGREWTATVLGNAGEEFGLSLYSDADDLFERMEASPDDEPFGAVRGQIIALTFDRLADVPREARHEARLRRWEVAGPVAFPELITVNTPAGGVTPEQIADLIVALQAVPAFIVEHRLPLEREERTGVPCRRIEWTHEPTGARLAYDGEAVRAGPAREDAEGAGEPGGPAPWIQAAVDAAVEEVGPGADDALIIAAVNRRLAGVTATWNDAPQDDFGGLSPAQVHRLLQRSDWVAGQGAIRLRTDLALPDLADAPTFANARSLLALAAETGGLAATAAGNLKLTVVEDLLDRLHFEEGYVPDLRAVSRRITEQDVGPLHEVRVLADVAGLLRRKGPRFVVTKRATRLLDDARAGELFARLFQTCFTEFNLAYGHALEWPELQHQIGYTLYRLGRVARDWRRAEDLVEPVVLPLARERAPRITSIDARHRILQSAVLDRLVGFALLERRSPPPSRARSGARMSRMYRVTRLHDAFVRFDL